MLEGLKNCKDKVGFILKRVPATRDSDRLLWVTYLNLFHDLRRRMDNSKDPYETFKRVVLDKDTPPMESIRRVRQKFQEGGQFIGKHRTERLEEAERVKKWLGGGVR